MKYIWRSVVEYWVNDDFRSLSEIHWIITNTDCAETVCNQIYSQLGEGYKIVGLQLKCKNPMEIK